jgi:hypothetical protein
MSKQRSKQTETEDASRADHLLNLFRDVSQRDPSPALRDRLAAFAAQRLEQNPGRSTRLLATHQQAAQVWLKLTLAAALLVVAGLATVFVVHSRWHEAAESDKTSTISHPSALPDKKTLVAPVIEPSPAKPPKVRRALHAIAPPDLRTRQMTMRLPYSNSAIETGTDTTIQITMSQSELLSLGFPLNATVQDRRVVAELTLGDDGLPRAISLPLPLEVMKEKK